MGSSSRSEEQSQQIEELSKTLKEGERILAPTRRPDGTLRKAIRIRAGYVPQEEVAIYQSKAQYFAKLKKEMAAQEVPPGYNPEPNAKSKTKAAKRNARKKEKRLQAALEKDSSEAADNDGTRVEDEEEEEVVESLTSQVNQLAVSADSAGAAFCPSDSVDSSNVGGGSGQDIDKKIRALKKKIRLAEAQLQKTPEQDMKPEQMNKLSKLQGWREELKLLENGKSELEAS